MNKTIICCLIAATISQAVADTEDSINEQRKAWAKQYFESHHMPTPDGGVTILPEKKMASYEETKERRLKIKKDIAKFGYVNEEEIDAPTLFNIKAIASHQYKKNKGNFDVTSTHLRHRIDELKMAYTFIGVPKTDMDEFIGVSPYLSYIKGEGWVGAMQYFTNKELGNCFFAENNVKLSHGSVIVAEEDVRNDINDKTTTLEVYGTTKDGFVYIVEWYDSVFFRTLKCAYPKYSEDKVNGVIELAKRIDNNNTI